MILEDASSAFWKQLAGAGEETLASRATGIFGSMELPARCAETRRVASSMSYQL